MVSVSERTMTRRNVEQAKGAERLDPKWDRLGVGTGIRDRQSPPPNPADSTDLKRAQNGQLERDNPRLALIGGRNDEQASRPQAKWG
jgi:hypothetical protein